MKKPLTDIQIKWTAETFDIDEDKLRNESDLELAYEQQANR